MPQETFQDTTRLILICEDRETGKKCMFNDLRATILSDHSVNLSSLIENNISLHYFLKNCMIFTASSDIDIVMGFYPSEELKSLELSIQTSGGTNTLTFRFEKIRTFPSDSEKSGLPNQNQILNNKNFDTEQQSNTNNCIQSQKNELDKFVSANISRNQCEKNAENSSSQAEEEKTIEKDMIKKEENDDQSNYCSKEDENSQQEMAEERDITKRNSSVDSYDESKESESQEIMQRDTEMQSEEEEKRSGVSINRKRRASEVLKSSKELSPCNSNTQNDQEAQIPLPTKKGKQSQGNFVCKEEQSQQSSSNQPNNNENIYQQYLTNQLQIQKPLNGFGQNSSFQVYNPSQNLKLNDIQGGINFNQFQQSHQKILQTQQTSNNSSNNIQNNNCGSGRQSRNKERTIKEAIDMVTKWRDLQEDYRQKHQVKGLQEVADELNISKKVLDYYFQELRTAEFFGFDFDSNLNSKMGVLRKFIDEQRRHHECENKNFKITRNLLFKYRLKEDSSGTSTSTSQSGIENNNVTASKPNNQAQTRNNNHNNSSQNQGNLGNLNGNNNNPSLLNLGIGDFSSIHSQNNEIFNENILAQTILKNTLQSDTAGGDKPIKKQDTQPLQQQQQEIDHSFIQEILSQNSPLFLSFFNSHYNNNKASNSNFLNKKNTVNSNSKTGFNVSQQQSKSNSEQKAPSTPKQKTPISQSGALGTDKVLHLLEFLTQSSQQTQNSQNQSNSAAPSIEEVENLMKLLQPNYEEAQNSEQTSAQKNNSPSVGFLKKKMIHSQKVAEVIQIQKNEDE